jgi:hypothetical protein
VFARILASSACGPGARHLGLPDEVDHRALGAQQPGRGRHDGVEDLVLVAHRADVGGDLAQRALGVGRAGEGGPRGGQLVDEAGIA